VAALYKKSLALQIFFIKKQKNNSGREKVPRESKKII
jgi:hypothetical protein